MASEAPTPKTSFAILPAKPKGTIEDWKAGNLPPVQPPQEKDPVPRKTAAPLRRKPNPDKTQVVAEPEDETGDQETEPGTMGPLSVSQVLSEMMRQRDDLDAAIRAVRKVMGGFR